jgi:predicted amidophosphoribosyltransferase
MAICPNCGNQAGEGAVFCDQCGARLPQPQAETPAAAPAGGAVICPSCGAGNVPGEAFCDFCGSPLEAPEPAVEQAVPTEEAAPELVAPEEMAPEEAAPEVPVVVEPPAAPPAGPTCPACGEEVQPGEAFCANCGASLAQPPIPPEPVAEAEPEAVPEPPAEVEAAPEEVTPAAPAEAVAVTCPACGSEVEAGDAFCSACGFVLQAVAEPSAAPTPPVGAPVAGPRLIVSASGAEIPLPDQDEIVVGREDPVSGIFPDVDLTPHGGEEGGVSRRHARLLKENGKYYVEDLDSTNFTFVNKQKLTPKTRQQVGEGDEIRFGRVVVELRTA